MKLRISILSAALMALALAAPALAKGPSEATIEGPGLKSGGIHLQSGGGDPSSGTPLGDLVDFGGYFPVTFGQEPDSTLKAKPRRDLGPKYAVVYKVPGPNGGTATLKQDLYPYALDGPVTYMRPGQPFFDGMKTHGGWFLAPRDYKQRLVALGLPRSAPSGDDGGGSTMPWSAVSVAAIALALLATTFVAFRRRPRPAGA